MANNELSELLRNWETDPIVTGLAAKGERVRLEVLLKEKYSVDEGAAVIEEAERLIQKHEQPAAAPPAAQQAGILSHELTSEDVAYLKWSREMEPIRCTIFQAFARSVSVETSTQNTESKCSESVAEKKFNVGKEAKRCFGRIYHEMIDKGSGNSQKKERFVVYDQFDGEAMNSTQALDPNDDEYITAAHIIPDKAVSNLVLFKVLNKGFQEKYDVNCLRNIILIKNKYSAALEAHKLGIAWNEEQGYFIKVGVDGMKEFANLNGKPLLFFEGGNQTNDPKYPPYRRSCAYSYLSVIHRIDTIYTEMRKISMTQETEERKDEQESMETAAQESMETD